MANQGGTAGLTSRPCNDMLLWMKGFFILFFRRRTTIDFSRHYFNTPEFLG